MWVAFTGCVVLLAAGLVALMRGGRTRAVGGVYFAVALVSVALLIAWWVANEFTGRGMTPGFLFHLFYGVEGAGVAEYRGMILGGTLVIAGATAVLGWSCLSVPQRAEQRRGLVAGAFVLLAGSVAVNPGVADLKRLLWPREAGADFFGYYRPPVLERTAEEHPNFVFIFAESFERTYFDETIFPGLVNELRELEKESVSFTELDSPEGTGFTMGGLVANLCGIPLISPAHPNSMSGMDEFLAGARAWTDGLREAGYHLAFYGGAHAHFGGKEKFLKTHGFAEVAGFSELHPRVSDPAYLNNWGLMDDTLLELAYARFEELSRDRRRFGLFVLTIDTHHPDGYHSRSEADRPYGDGGNSMLSAVTMSDRLIAKFVRKIRASEWGTNTVIAIASDHLAMENVASDLLRRGERRNLFMVLDPRVKEGRRVERTGATFDVGATFLPFLGFRSPVGLGRDLLNPAVSDEWRMTRQSAETLRAWRRDLLEFWEFPRLRRDVVFRMEGETVAIDGRRFRAPVLVELDEVWRTKLRFEFDATWDVRLAEQATRLEEGTRFLLIAKKEDVRALTAVEAIDAEWVAVIGIAGRGASARPLADGTQISKEKIEATLARVGER